MILTTGRWLVTTENSTYELDLNRGTISRSPGDNAYGLSLDGETLELRGLFSGPTVGERFVFAYIDLNGFEDLIRTSVVTGVDELV